MNNLPVLLVIFQLFTSGQTFISFSQLSNLVRSGRWVQSSSKSSSNIDSSSSKPITEQQTSENDLSEISLEQLIEFKKLGKFQLNQIRSQLDYGSVLNNYRMNINFQLRKVGLLNPQSRAENNSVCYHEIGCIEISDKWYSMTRPVNLLPLDRAVINTQFILRTRNNLQERFVKISDPENFASSGFVENKPVKFIIHGFIDTGREQWVKDMSEAILEAEDCNVISVDWGGGSLPLYSQAAANTRVVGLEVAHFINTLIINYGARAKDVHIIGHSLGAHIAGYAGERVPGLARITGLDPAEPLFQDMPEFVRLDPSDAHFVDVIHTDAKSIMLGGYGMKQAVGHLDFYPNGGQDQPGCSLLAPLIFSALTVEENGGCLDCGKAGERCSLLGYYSSKPKDWLLGETRKMFLETGPLSPFCQHNYVVEMNVGENEESEDWVQGHVNLNLYGDKGEVIKHKITEKDVSRRFQKGTKNIFKVSLSKNIGLVSIAEIFWKYDHEIDPFDLGKMCLVFCSDSLYLDSLTITSFIPDKENNIKSRRQRLCGETESPIQSGDWKLFYKPCSGSSSGSSSQYNNNSSIQLATVV